MRENSKFLFSELKCEKEDSFIALELKSIRSIAVNSYKRFISILFSSHHGLYSVDSSFTLASTGIFPDTKCLGILIKPLPNVSHNLGVLSK